MVVLLLAASCSSSSGTGTPGTGGGAGTSATGGTGGASGVAGTGGASGVAGAGAMGGTALGTGGGAAGSGGGAAGTTGAAGGGTTGSAGTGGTATGGAGARRDGVGRRRERGRGRGRRGGPVWRRWAVAGAAAAGPAAAARAAARPERRRCCRRTAGGAGSSRRARCFYGTPADRSSLAGGQQRRDQGQRPGARLRLRAPRTTTIIELHTQLELDDHDAPAFLVRPDGRLLTLYGKHDSENHFYYRISQRRRPDLGRGADLRAEREHAASPTATSTCCPAEANRIYDFYRGLDGSFKPSYASSDDAGQSWKSGNVVINFTSGRRCSVPTSATRRTAPTPFTSSTPRPTRATTTPASITSITRGARSTAATARALAALTAGDHRRRRGRASSRPIRSTWPGARTSCSIRSDGRSSPTRSRSDRRGCRSARGATTSATATRAGTARPGATTPLAYAGSRLYSGEDDYSGLATLDPGDVSVVYISTNANPTTGVPLMSAGDGLRHYELFRGVTATRGRPGAGRRSRTTRRSTTCGRSLPPAVGHPEGAALAAREVPRLHQLPAAGADADPRGRRFVNRAVTAPVRAFALAFAFAITGAVAILTCTRSTPRSGSRASSPTSYR